MYYYPHNCHCWACQTGYTNINNSPNIYQTSRNSDIRSEDQGGKPFVININKAAKDNITYRTAIWTSCFMQVTLMSINVGDDIGLEVHPHTDQFLRIEDGNGLVMMGSSKNNLTYRKQVSDDDAIMVPAGTWHNLKNIGNKPLKLYSIYAPPHHPFGTIEQTKEDAMHESNNLSL